MYFFDMFISLLYIFRATQCSSSGESIVSIIDDEHCVVRNMYKVK